MLFLIMVMLYKHKLRPHTHTVFDRFPQQLAMLNPTLTFMKQSLLLDDDMMELYLFFQQKNP